MQINSRHICRQLAADKRSDQTAAALVTGVKWKWPDSNWPNILPSQHVSARISVWWLHKCLFVCQFVSMPPLLYYSVCNLQNERQEHENMLPVGVCVFVSDYRAEKTFSCVFLLFMSTSFPSRKNHYFVDLSVCLFLCISTVQTAQKELGFFVCQWAECETLSERTMHKWVNK